MNRVMKRVMFIVLALLITVGVFAEVEKVTIVYPNKYTIIDARTLGWECENSEECYYIVEIFYQIKGKYDLTSDGTIIKGKEEYGLYKMKMGRFNSDAEIPNIIFKPGDVKEFTLYGGYK